MVKSMQECMDEPEDVAPVTVCSVIQGCGGSESVIYSGLVVIAQIATT
jgi:hypothetical protein